MSYADFITLLFAFFTTLYAISTVDAQKGAKLVRSMRESFDSAVFDSGSRSLSLSQGSGGTATNSRDVLQTLNPGSGISGSTVALKASGDLKFRSSKRPVISGEREFARLRQNVESLLGSSIQKGTVRTHVEPRGLVISLGEKGNFDSGSDQIRPEGIELLNTLSTSLVSLGNDLRVEGHTDNVPINNSKFPSNWELSTARATAVVSYLIMKLGLPPDLLSAAGYAEYHPSESNDTVEGRARNRRVDIVVLNPAASAMEPR